MIPLVIPSGISLTVDDLKKEPSEEMTLETLKLHMEALKNLHLNYGPLQYDDVVIPWVAELLRKYGRRLQNLEEATDFGNWVAPCPTTEQLRQWVCLLQERRLKLAHPETHESISMVEKLALIIKNHAFDHAAFGRYAPLWIDDHALEQMMPYVIPNDVLLTLDDLMMEPSEGMTLETLELYKEALTNLQLRYVSFRPENVVFTAVEALQDLYSDSIRFITPTDVFNEETPFRRGNLLIPETTLADVHNHVSTTPSDHSAAPRAESVFSDRGLTGSSGGIEIERKNMNRGGWYGDVVKVVEDGWMNNLLDVLFFGGVTTLISDVDVTTHQE
ncbi:hypothetical protein SeLEV6574_g04609 [Synchytrium endobioticum]|nr:hypothetical protein SeLEV6574_g04609 [Synchytrium endobioticum]